MRYTAHIPVRFGQNFDPSTILRPELDSYQEQLSLVELWHKVWSESRLCPIKKRSKSRQLDNNQTHMEEYKEPQHEVKIRELSEVLHREDMDDFWHSEHPPVRGAFEHFFEDIMRIKSAYERNERLVLEYKHNYYLVGYSDKEFGFAVNSSNFHGGNDFYLLVPLGEERKHISSNSERLNNVLKSINHKIYDEYWNYPFFKNFAKRFFVESSMENLAYVCMSMLEYGHQEVFIKHTMPKYGVWRIALSDCKNIMDIETLLLAHLKQVRFISNYSNKNSFIVQPAINFRNEYRFFITNGRILKGVPVRRKDNVFDGNDKYRIEPYICLHHDGHDRVYDRQLPARYAWYVRKMLNYIRQNRTKLFNPDDLNMVIDMGSDEYGEIYPIEVNSLLNAGTYGFHGRTILSSMLEADIIRREQIKQEREREKEEERKRFQKRRQEIEQAEQDMVTKTELPMKYNSLNFYDDDPIDLLMMTHRSF